MWERDIRMNTRIYAILEQYCKTLPAQLASMLDLFTTRHYSAVPPEIIARNIQTETHRMSGAAHCMGYRELGRELARIEERLSNALQSHTASLEDVFQRLVPRFVRIDGLLDGVKPENSRLMALIGSDHEAPESMDIPSEAAAIDLKSQRILVADDDPFILEILSSYLADFGVEHIHCVANGLQVLGALRSFKPDIVITDWQMEPVSGIEILQCIRNGGTPLRKDTPVLLFTSNRDQESRHEVSINGADHHLTKPISPRIVHRTLLDVIERRRTVRSAPYAAQPRDGQSRTLRGEDMARSAASYRGG